MIDRLFGFVDRPVQRIERSSSPLVLFACLAAGEIHAATSQAVGDFVPRGIATFCGQVRCVP